jgi:hypothetical protein
MDLTFNQVEAVFVRRFDIPDEKAVAFRGRLQHLQRLNFPQGVNTGRGKKASYGWLQVIQLTVALDLIDLGMTPDLVARTVKQGSDRIVDAVAKVTLAFESAQKLSKAIYKARCPFGITQIAVFSTYALTFSRTDDQPGMILTYSGKDFLEQFAKDPAVEPTAAFVNLGARMMLVAQFVGRTTALDPIKVAEDLLAWANDRANEETMS